MAERIAGVEVQLPPSGTPMTDDEYMALPETNQLVELIGGVLIVSPTPIPLHQRISRRLLYLLEKLIPNGELFYAPMGVRLDEFHTPEPDLIWVAEGSRCVIGDKRLEGPPDLVVEIFSPGSTLMDRREKFELYQRFAVAEYWMADPLAQYVEVYRLDGEHYVRQGVYGPGETFASAALGQTVDLTGVFD